MDDNQETSAAHPPLQAHKPWQVSVVIPAWNEQDSILDTIREAQQSLSAFCDEYEIIVADDASTDATTCLVSDYIRKSGHDPDADCTDVHLSGVQPHPQATAQTASAPDSPRRVRLVRLPKHRGMGAALRAGIRAARFDHVVISHSSGQLQLEDLRYLLPLTEHHDVVAGYRIENQESLPSRLLSGAYGLLARLTLRLGIRDVACGLRVFHRQQLLRILPKSDNYFAAAELISRARSAGLRIVETGVHHRACHQTARSIPYREIPRTIASLLPFAWSEVQFPVNTEKPPASLIKPWQALTLIVVVAVVMLYSNLSYRLIEPDEGRYAEIPREMLASGDWVIPTLHFRPYYDKPPLLYWLIAGSYQVFGVAGWAARLIPATGMLLTIVTAFLWGSKRLGTSAAFLGSMLLTLTLTTVLCGRFLILDGLLTLFVTLSLVMAYEAVMGPKFNWLWWLMSGLACGLGVLTKGPVALVLLGPPVVALGWLNRRNAVTQIRSWFAYGLAITAVTAPWYIMVALRDPTFLTHFFWEHNIQRFIQGANHPEPFWFYIPVLFAAFLPWSLLFPLLGRLLFGRQSELRRQRTPVIGFLVLWSGWCIGFFSISSGKLPPYILPAFPAIALMLGHAINQAFPIVSRSVSNLPAKPAVFIRGAGFLCLTAVFGLVGAAVMQLTGLLVGFLLAAVFLGLFVVLYRFRHQGSARINWAICSLLALAVESVIAHDLVPTWSVHRDILMQSSEVTELLSDESIPLACWGREWGSVPFYLNRNDVSNFSNRPPEEVRDFVHAHPRSLLLLTRGTNAEYIRAVLPENAEMSEPLEFGDPQFGDVATGKLVYVHPRGTRDVTVSVREVLRQQRIAMDGVSPAAPEWSLQVSGLLAWWSDD